MKMLRCGFWALLTVILVFGVNNAIPTAITNQVKARINPHHIVHNLHNQIKAKEEEIKNAEMINRNFERMIQLVNILGQVDNFLTERTKAVIKKLALLVDDEKNHERHSSSDEDDD